MAPMQFYFADEERCNYVIAIHQVEWRKKMAAIQLLVFYKSTVAIGGSLLYTVRRSPS